MAFRQRTINGTVVDGDGSPIANAEVKFKPTQLLAYTATHIVVDAAFTVQTDAGGDFSIDIWCDEDSLVPVNYNVYFPTTDGGQANDDHRASFSLEYGDGSAVNLAQLINGSIPAPTPDELLYEFINQAIEAHSKWTPLSFSDAGTLTAAQSGSVVTASGSIGAFQITLPPTTDPDLVVGGTRFAFRLTGEPFGVNTNGQTVYYSQYGELASASGILEPSGADEGYYIEIYYIGGGKWQGGAVVGKWNG
jgi:hypothetical protein